MKELGIIEDSREYPAKSVMGKFRQPYILSYFFLKSLLIIVM